MFGTVSASEFIRVLHAGGRPTGLGRAIAELGRAPKTVHLLKYVDDPVYRRGILVQLNRQKGRHSLARAVFHGQRGELRQRYREGQEDQLDALGLVVNAIALWNTRYIDAALDHLRERGRDVLPGDVRRLSPKWASLTSTCSVGTTLGSPRRSEGAAYATFASQSILP